MRKYCGHCGNWMDPSAKRCPYCGTRKKAEFPYPILAAILILLSAFLIGRRYISGELFAPEYAAQTKLLSQVKKYDGERNLCTQFDFIYDQNRLSLIRTLHFQEAGQTYTVSEIPIEYDEEGRLIRYGILGEGRYEEYEYDSNGALIRCLLAEGGTEEIFYKYDSLGRLEETLSDTDGVTSVYRYAYDNDGRCLRKDVYNYYKANSYDEDRSYNMQVYLYRYDSQGNLIEIDGDLGKTVYTYDEQGRKVKEVIESPYGYTYTTCFDYEYPLFSLCSSTYLDKTGYCSSICNAELRYADTCPVWTVSINPDSIITGDEDGYLTRITAVDGSSIVEFLYA